MASVPVRWPHDNYHGPDPMQEYFRQHPELTSEILERYRAGTDVEQIARDLFGEILGVECTESISDFAGLYTYFDRVGVHWQSREVARKDKTTEPVADSLFPHLTELEAALADRLLHPRDQDAVEAK